MEVCSESHLLPTEFCPETVKVRFARNNNRPRNVPFTLLRRYLCRMWWG